MVPLFDNLDQAANDGEINYFLKRNNDNVKIGENSKPSNYFNIGLYHRERIYPLFSYTKEDIPQNLRCNCSQKLFPKENTKTYGKSPYTIVEEDNTNNNASGDEDDPPENSSSVPLKVASISSSFPFKQASSSSSVPFKEASISSSVPFKEVSNSSSVPFKELSSSSSVPFKETFTNSSVQFKEASTSFNVQCKDASTQTDIENYNEEEDEYLPMPTDRVVYRPTSSQTNRGITANASTSRTQSPGAYISSARIATSGINQKSRHEITIDDPVRKTYVKNRGPPGNTGLYRPLGSSKVALGAQAAGRRADSKQANAHTSDSRSRVEFHRSSPSTSYRNLTNMHGGSSRDRGNRTIILKDSQSQTDNNTYDKNNDQNINENNNTEENNLTMSTDRIRYKPTSSQNNRVTTANENAPQAKKPRGWQNSPSSLAYINSTRTTTSGINQKSRHEIANNDPVRKNYVINSGTPGKAGLYRPFGSSKVALGAEAAGRRADNKKANAQMSDARSRVEFNRTTSSPYSNELRTFVSDGSKKTLAGPTMQSAPTSVYGPSRPRTDSHNGRVTVSMRPLEDTPVTDLGNVIDRRNFVENMVKLDTRADFNIQRRENHRDSLGGQINDINKIINQKYVGPLRGHNNRNTILKDSESQTLGRPTLQSSPTGVNSPQWPRTDYDHGRVRVWTRPPEDPPTENRAQEIDGRVNVGSMVKLNSPGNPYLQRREDRRDSAGEKANINRRKNKENTGFHQYLGKKTIIFRDSESQTDDNDDNNNNKI